jgi:hypothetical protein
MEQDDWSSISRAIEIIKEASGGSTGAAQARLIEACASGKVRSRIPADPKFDPVYLMADDGLMGMDLRPGARRRPQSQAPGPTAWRDGTIDGNRLVDASGKHWSRVEISIDDLRYCLDVAPPTEAAKPRSQVSNVDLTKFVAAYGDRERAAGKSPTQVGLERAARTAGLEATRGRLISEFKQRFAPISGRPKKSRQEKVAGK